MKDALALEHIKVDHHARKVQKASISIGKYMVREIGHNDWEVSTAKGEYIDTFSRRDHAVAFVKALKLR
jgi:hypothetical protein